MTYNNTCYIIVDITNIDSMTSHQLESYLENVVYSNEREALKELDLLKNLQDSNSEQNLGVIKVVRTTSYEIVS